MVFCSICGKEGHNKGNKKFHPRRRRAKLKGATTKDYEKFLEGGSTGDRLLEEAYDRMSKGDPIEFKKWQEDIRRNYGY